MIQLPVSNNTVFVWNVKDWEELRETHRIVGTLVGCLPRSAYQDNFLGLPMQLMPEEATLLYHKKLATLIEQPGLVQPPRSSMVREFEKFRKDSFSEQVECCRDQRRKQVESMIDKIVEGKLKKLKNSEGEAVVNRDEILHREMSRAATISEDNAAVQIFTADPWVKPEDAKPAYWTYPTTAVEKTRYAVYTDLWERGYYITSGEKFGCDYLVYPGDPVKYHAQFIVKCIKSSVGCQILPEDLVTLGRLGTNVKKTLLYAIRLNNQITYQSVQWVHNE